MEKSNRKTLPAFTLVEVVIVLMVIGIVAAIVIPMHVSAASTELKIAANIVASDLEYAKSMAISTGKSYSVVFNTSAESYCIKDSAGQVITHPVHLGSSYIVSFAGDGRLDKVNIVSTTFGAANTIKFDSLGSPYDGTGAALTNGVVQLGAEKQTIKVKVEPVTGYISIE
jgi:prepilin-type N-terminal cleavage/methylation domain-containing protein